MEYTDFTFSMPTCYQLGIPNEPSAAELQGLAYPFPPQMVPVPHPLYDCNLEPAFIRKRNERERIRVRHVNEGYARLREHLPNEPTEKRMSKVETLRAAIRYIRRLETLLDNAKEKSVLSEKNAAAENDKWKSLTIIYPFLKLWNSSWIVYMHVLYSINDISYSTRYTQHTVTKWFWRFYVLKILEFLSFDRIGRADLHIHIHTSRLLQSILAMKYLLYNCLKIIRQPLLLVWLITE